MIREAHEGFLEATVTWWDEQDGRLLHGNARRFYGKRTCDMGELFLIFESLKTYKM